MARVRPGWNARHRVAALHRIAPDVDLFWVIDYPSLPTVIDVVTTSGAKVVYETVDLVPEYLYQGECWSKQALDGERRLIGRVDGFITACDGYADYYVERYGDEALRRRPLVTNNMPAAVASQFKPTARPLRLLFLGSLMADRPVLELIEAMALSSADVTLAFQGKNLLGSGPADRIAELGLEGCVTVLDPCPPDAIVEVASTYDVGIGALRGLDENERRASISKLFTYMSAGLAILGSDLPGIARIVGEHHNGVLVQGAAPEDWAAAVDAIARLTDSAIDAMRQESLNAANEYRWERQRPDFIMEFVHALGRR